MKAAIQTRNGPPDVVQLADVAVPVPADGEVLIRVRAVSLNPIDWHFLRGEPWMLRLMAGLFKPKLPQLGIDVAGRVQSVGPNVNQLKPGDEVFGTCRGACAEFACTTQSKLTLKPNNISFEQAAAVPIAAYTALQGLRLGGLGGKSRAQSPQKVLINGAAGGVGTFAVQIAKSFGAEVTGVCSAHNMEMVRSLGAARVIDYTREDFTRGSQHYDLVFDCVGNHALSAYRCVLNPQGTYIPIAGAAGWSMIGPLVLAITALVSSLFVSQKLVPFFLAKVNQDDLRLICELIETGKVMPVIDRRYKLTEVPDAIRYLEEGHARGKVVIVVD